MSSMPGSGRGRGGYAPRRGRGGWAHPFVKRQEPTKPDTTKHPLGQLITSLKNSDLESSQANMLPLSHISNCQYVTSYNWLRDKKPTILVPGKYSCFLSLRIWMLTWPRSTSPMDTPESRSETTRGQWHLLPRPKRRTISRVSHCPCCASDCRRFRSLIDRR